MNRIIKTETEYEKAIAELVGLLDSDPNPGTPDYEKLELLTLLIQDYESKNYQFVLPDPVEAIRFRMEQQKLTPRDLIPYIGSRSKVSEILSKKRPLTISMIRALHFGLGIPSNILIQQQEAENEDTIDWDRFPIKQMMSWGWVNNIGDQFRSEEILRPFLSVLGELKPKAILYRSSSHVRSARTMDDYALAAWSARVLTKALANQSISKYNHGILTTNFLRQVVQLSASPTGPLMARDFLKQHGIQLIVERHLLHTYLDGAVIMTNKSLPVIALTLRYDRIDNFWFTLMHELSHLALHMNNEIDIFYDDLDIDDQNDSREQEANQLAADVLIPHDAWENSPASRLRSPQAAEHLARTLNIHPAIVAGRMQHEFKAFQLLRHLTGKGEVRKLFPEVDWR